ncbi:MAG: transcriptional regulator, partial [Pseudonocardia sp.]|nr:transcriptional regulator [Pseudonocardia sp.]
TRLFHEELGTTPAKYVESVRFDGAKAALESGYTISEAAERVGYGSPETLRRAFVARLGVSPSAYQQRFRSAQRRDAVVGGERRGRSEPRRYSAGGANRMSAVTER